MARAFAAIVFMLIGIFAAAVGVHDAFAGIEVGSRFGGLLLLIAGVALISVAVILVVLKLKWAPTAGIFVAPAGAMVGLSLIVAQLLSVDRDWQPVEVSVVIAIVLGLAVAFQVLAGRDRAWLPALLAVLLLASAYLAFRHGDHDERIVIWASMVIACGLAAYVLWDAEPPNISMSPSRLFIGIFGFFSLGALISGAQLWYTSQYVPSHLAPSLTIESTLSQERDANGLEVAELTLTVINTSQTQAKVLGSLYRVTGSTVDLADQADQRFARQLKRPQVKSQPVLRYRRIPEWDTVQVGRIFPEGFWLDPNEKFSTKALIYVPHGRYDVLRTQSQVLFAKGSALTVNERDRHLYPFSARDEFPFWGVVATWPIDETSWFRDLTRANRELEVDWVAGRRSRPGLAHFPLMSLFVRRVGEERTPSAFADYNDRAATFYGLAKSVSTTETPLRHGGGA